MPHRTIPKSSRPSLLGRRDLLRVLSAAGVTSAVFSRALLSLAAEKKSVTPEMIRQAEWISGLALTDEQRTLMVADLDRTQASYAALRAVPLDNAVPPALRFEVPAPAAAAPRGGKTPAATTAPAARPSSDDDLAFAPVTVLSSLLRARKVSSVELTRLYLDRLRRFDPVLHCAITITDDLALAQARRADEELGRGRWRGPLHGVPYGVKDLLAVPGYPTTWGATPFRGQERPEKATVVARLEEAGAVLLAKTAVGELAWGDVWFGGMTRNPWKVDQGSSGSSAGSASAAAAGLAGFAIGTETWGSIVSPCTRCGASGLRPTFGRVSRHGAMALAWSMDKIGPIGRSAEDCALVFGAIHGPDGLDLSVNDRGFDWPSTRDPRTLRVGVAEALFEKDYSGWADPGEDPAPYKEWQALDRESLAILRRLGVRLVPVRLPEDLPVGALSIILTAEAATAFDELTRSGRDATLVRQVADAWPNTFRQGQIIPAVEYIRANRIRTLLIRDMEKALADVDVLVAPTFGGDHLLATNLTGHPAVVVPNGFRADGTPTSLTFTGRWFGETALLALARLWQAGTDFHRRRPPLPPPGPLPPSRAAGAPSAADGSRAGAGARPAGSAP